MIQTQIGELIVGAYLRVINDCELVSYNQRSKEAGRQMEVDVLGVESTDGEQTVYACEVVTHIRGSLYSGSPDEEGWWNKYGNENILDLLNDPPVEEIRVSETIRMTERGEMANGVWDGSEQRIVIRRQQLNNVRDFASTLLHEVAHPRSGGAPDLSKPFEDALTGLLGEIAESAISKQ